MWIWVHTRKAHSYDLLNWLDSSLYNKTTWNRIADTAELKNVVILVDFNKFLFLFFFSYHYPTMQQLADVVPYILKEVG